VFFTSGSNIVSGTVEHGPEPDFQFTVGSNLVSGLVEGGPQLGWEYTIGSELVDGTMPDLIHNMVADPVTVSVTVDTPELEEFGLVLHDLKPNVINAAIQFSPGNLQEVEEVGYVPANITAIQNLSYIVVDWSPVPNVSQYLVHYRYPSTGETFDPSNFETQIGNTEETSFSYPVLVTGAVDVQVFGVLTSETEGGDDGWTGDEG